MQQAGSGKTEGKSFGANIREAVALGVAGVKARLPGQIQAERVGRAEAGPLPNQNNRHVCAEAGGYFVADGDPALLDKGASVRQRFAQRGLDATVHRKEQEKRKERLLDGDGEAPLIALVCSAPPDGHTRWGLHLLKDTLIEQRIVNTISHEAVRQTLKKMNSSPG